MSRWRLSVLVFLMLSGRIFAGEVAISFPFAETDVSFSSAGGYDRIFLAGGTLPSDPPGTPWLPAKFVSVLIPSGAEVEAVDASASEVVLRENVLVYPVQPARPRSKPRGPFVPPDSAAYDSTDVTPSQPAALTGTQNIRGYTLVSVRLNPVRYNPGTGRVTLAREIGVVVRYRLPGVPPSISARNSELFESSVDALAVNPVARVFAPLKKAAPRTASPRGTVDYLILTSATLSNSFQVLADHRASSSGLGATVQTVESVTNTYPGTDAQDRIRNCIKSYVSNGLAYVVLGGDETIVPDRDCYAYAEGEIDAQMPTDLYYSGLEGNWDSDGDGTYGETSDSVDMGWDVIVGRIPVRNAAQAANYINKLRNYETNTPLILSGKILLGGMEAWDSYTGNNRPTDDITGDGHLGFRDAAHPTVSDSEMWDRRLFRDGIRPYWLPDTIGIFCDTLTSWDSSTGGDYSQTDTNLKAKFNLGWYHVFFSGHGNVDIWGLESGYFDSLDAAALTGKTAVVYTDACLTGAFEDSTDPCLSEAFLRNANGGALVYIGCSRYGWGSPDSPPASNTSDGGPSTVYAYKFYKRLHETNNMILGRAFAMHKADMVAESGYYNCERWIQFGLNFQGDPALRYIPPTNIPPQIALSPSRTNRSIQVSNAVSIAVTVSERDHDSTTLWATNLPAGAAFPTTNGIAPMTNTFLWTPAAGQTGVFTVAFFAGDKDGTNSVGVRITVREAGVSLDVSGYSLVQYTSYTNYVIPDGTEVPARGYVVIARNVTKAQFTNYWRCTLGSNVVYVNSGNKFPAINGSEQYELYDSTGVSIDGATPPGRDPNTNSIQRKNADDDATVDDSWTAACITNQAAATPGCGGYGQGVAGLVISEYSDSARGASNEFVELYYDSSPAVGTNRAPALALSPAGTVQSVTVSNLLSFGVTATEPNGNSVRLWATNLPAGATFGATNGLSPLTNSLVWTPTNTGTWYVPFYAGDRDGTNSVLVTIVVAAAPSEGGGLETFENFTNSSASYLNGTFLGQDGSTWTYVQCRGDKSIDGKSPCLARNASPTSEVYSGTLRGGCGEVTFSYRQEYSIGVKMDVLVNGAVIGTVITSNSGVQTAGPYTANTAGSFVLGFRQSYGGASGQASIDNVSWTPYGAIVDTDGDGIDDSWETDHFGTLTNEACGDNDDDGFCNGDEYAADTDPMNASAFFELESLCRLAGCAVSFLSTNSRVYTLQWAPDLLPGNTWSNLGAALAGTNGLLSISDTNNALNRAYRVRVSTP